MKLYVVCFLAFAAVASAQMHFQFLNVPFNAIIGMDYYEPTDQIVVSYNYPSGNPHTFALIDQDDGMPHPFSSVSGFGDEVKIATAISDGTPGGMTMGGFVVGDLFVGNGNDGQIVRITDGGATVLNPWVSLPAGAGLMRGSLVVDRTGVWNGCLIVCTTSGKVYEVASNGAYNLLASAGTHLEGINIGPNDPARLGGLAGAIIIGRETIGDIMVIPAGGGAASYYPLSYAGGPVRVEDIDIVREDSNWFGAAYANNRIAAIPAADFVNYIGEILVNVEGLAGAQKTVHRGLFWIRWNFATSTPYAVGLGDDPGFVGTDIPNQWEHMTFGHAGIEVIGSGSDCDVEHHADESCNPAQATTTTELCVTLCLDTPGGACSGVAVIPP